MKKKTFLFMVAALIVVVGACKKDENNPVQSPTTGTIQGKVTNATGDTAIAGGTVTTSPPTSSVTTNSLGGYTIPNVSPGTYSVTAIKGGYNPTSVTISVSAGNTTTANIPLNLMIDHPPNVPTLVSPSDGATSQSTTLTLRWRCSDPDGDPLTYDVYFDKNNPPSTLVVSNQSDTSISESNLDASATYYWRVVAKDNKGASTYGNVWRFTTATNNIPTQGLVAYYPFSGNANDESGNGNNGIVNGATLASDRFGNAYKAYSFNGGTNRIQSDIANIPIGNSSRTISLWANGTHDSTSSFWSECILMYSGAGTHDDAFSIFYNHDPLLSGFGVGICYDVRQYYLSSDNFFNGHWKHIVVLYDQQTSKMIFYIDGVKVDEQVHAINTGAPSYHFNLGIENGAAGLRRPFFGKIDDVRIYNRVLTDTEIQQLYHEGGW